MKSGHYSLCLRAATYEGLGTFEFSGYYGTGRDDHYDIELQFLDLTERVVGIVSVLRISSMGELGELGDLPVQHALQVTGTVGDSHFDLSGIGPDGIVIHVSGFFQSISKPSAAGSPSVISRPVDRTQAKA